MPWASKTLTAYPLKGVCNCDLIYLNCTCIVLQDTRSSKVDIPGGGGTDLERGYGDVRPWRPPFHASPVVRKGPISSKRVSSQDSLLRKFGNFSLYSLNFHPNFSSQAPKFGNFQLTSPPFQRQMSVRKPHTSEIRAAHPYLKKSWVPLSQGWHNLSVDHQGTLVKKKINK